VLVSRLLRHRRRPMQPPPPTATSSPVMSDDDRPNRWGDLPLHLTSRTVDGAKDKVGEVQDAADFEETVCKMHTNYVQGISMAAESTLAEPLAKDGCWLFASLPSTVAAEAVRHLPGHGCKRTLGRASTDRPQVRQAMM